MSGVYILKAIGTGRWGYLIDVLRYKKSTFSFQMIFKPLLFIWSVKFYLQMVGQLQDIVLLSICILTLCQASIEIALILKNWLIYVTQYANDGLLAQQRIIRILFRNSVLICKLYFNAEIYSKLFLICNGNKLNVLYIEIDLSLIFPTSWYGSH